jgi:hypothetical protein
LYDYSIGPEAYLAMLRNAVPSFMTILPYAGSKESVNMKLNYCLVLVAVCIVVKKYKVKLSL